MYDRGNKINNDMEGNGVRRERKRDLKTDTDKETQKRDTDKEKQI